MAKQINYLKKARRDKTKCQIKRKIQLVKELLSFDFRISVILLLFLET